MTLFSSFVGNNLLEKPTVLSFMREFDREFFRLLKTVMCKCGYRKINQVSVISFYYYCRSELRFSIKQLQ